MRAVVAIHRPEGTRAWLLAASRRDRLARAVARRLPRRVVYWAVVRAGANATRGHAQEVSAEVTVLAALLRWPVPGRKG